MTTLFLDTEGSNLLPMCDTIWVTCTKAGDDERSFRCAQAFKAYVRELKPTVIVGHNLLGYDLESLRKNWGCDYTVGRQDTFLGMPVEFRDTLLLSQYLNADRQPTKLGHGLKGWGIRLGDYKGDFKDFSKWSEAMEAYCVQDVRLCQKVYEILLREINDY